MACSMLRQWLLHAGRRRGSSRQPVALHCTCGCRLPRQLQVPRLKAALQARCHPPPVQVVAGTNSEIRINVTCPSANNSDNDNTLGLEAHVFWPLPGSNEEPEVHAALACTLRLPALCAACRTGPCCTLC